MRLPKFVLPMLLRLHESAESTPYFHLKGYMIRDWIFGYYSPDRNAARPANDPWHGVSGGLWYRLLAKLVCIRAHTILRSDKDRHLHDHPCASLSVVLEGGYWEVCLPTVMAMHHQHAYLYVLKFVDDGCAEERDIQWLSDWGIHWRRPGAVVFRRAKTSHRLVLPKGGVTKSIFIMGPKTNSWGFYTPNGKIGWREYLGVSE